MRLPSQVAFYHTAAWLKCREAYIASVGGLCERCAAKGIIRTGDIVHHKEWITEQNINDPEILLSFDNLNTCALIATTGSTMARITSVIKSIRQEKFKS